MKLELKNISKNFHGVKALQNVDFQLKENSIHALLGENGAGKSTLVKILCGVYQPDSGSIHLNNQQQTISNPAISLSLGISAIHQESVMFDELTVTENIFIGNHLTKSNRLIDWGLMESKTKQLLEELEANIEPNEKIKDLSIAQRHIVQISRSLIHDADIVIMDEPTASLSQKEINELYTIIRNLKKQNKSIIFISHKLDEVLEIADEISVMRSGQMIDTVVNDNVSKTQLAEMMIGKSLPSPPARVTSTGEKVILKVENIKSTDEDGRTIFEEITFEVNKSEILGIAGVEGNGQKEVVEAIIGIQALDSGKVIFMDNDIEGQGTRERLESGISFIPEDRQLQAMIMDMNLTNNVIIGRQNIDKYKSSLGTMKMKNAVNESEKVISSFDVKTPGTSTLATALSGGNQQKFVVGRELEDNPSLLIASQPTRGIDIGAQALIWEKLRNSRDEGLSVLLISADLEELIGLSDRIIVFYQGKLVKELDAENVSPEDLGGYMTGLKK